MPGDIRNDLFVTLVSAEFEKGRKTAGRNVDVEMAVVLGDGTVLPNCLAMGVGEPSASSYHSTIYYHNNTPHWNETVKIEIPIDAFDKAHLRFYFRHCPSQEPRDRQEIFGFAFLPLMSTDARDTEPGVAIKVCPSLFPACLPSQPFVTLLIAHC
jgi:hypothetical protein